MLEQTLEPADPLVDSLAACLADSARQYLARHGVRCDGIAVRAEYADYLNLSLTVPDAVSPEQVQALYAMIAQCDVISELRRTLRVSVDISTHGSAKRRHDEVA